MWRKLKEFSRKDPLIFVLAIVFIVTAGAVGGVQIMHMTSTAKFCRTCHPEEHVGVLGEYYTWDKNIHSKVDVSCLDCHGEPGVMGYLYAHVVAGTKSLVYEVFASEETKIEMLTHAASDPHAAEHAAPDETCLFCHTDKYNEKFRRENIMSIGAHFRHIDEVYNPDYRESYGMPDILSDGVTGGVEPNHKVHTEDAGLVCAECHLGVAHGGELYNRPEMDTCFECHDEVRAEYETIPANEDCAACHTMNEEVQNGTLVEGVEELPWYMASLECGDCHMDAYTPPNSDGCINCHGDAFYGQMLFDIQKDYEEKLKALNKRYKPLFEQREHMEPGRMAIFNEYNDIVKILQREGSKGVHNPEYFDMLFEKAAELEEEIHNWTVPVEDKLLPHADQQAMHEEEEKEEEPAGPINSPEHMEIVEAVDTINLAERYVADPSKPAVIFQHKMHAENLACTECHAEPEMGTLKVEIGEVKGMKNAFHDKLCIDCHKERRVSRSCNTCHAK
ncbi:cytochrome c3 family protein [Limisalsivibrio acetivorans]|uniref:cytochrome c3 family protein n=1 Tax=Limisalsivibrio acetivorans TaxID=1304888 RepID=UPI0003B6A164|nr:cytochrome c3 family protein [Limisalsivibrio acetivorans]